MMKYAVVATILCAANAASADSQLWLEAGASLKPKKRVELQVSPQIRLGDDASKFYGFLPELSARYRVKKWLRVGGGYRFEYERVGRSELFVTTHRASIDARLRGDLGDVRVDYRLMLVEKYRPVADSMKTELRNRIDVSYRAWRPWVPFVGSEVFLGLGDFDKVEYDKLRVTAGMMLGREQHDIEMFMRAELHADPMDPTFYIFGLGYHYQL